MKICTIIIINLLFFLASCKSPVSTIANSANEVSTLAQSSKERFEKIGVAAKTEVIDAETIVTQVDLGISEQSDIIELTKTTLAELTKVEDKVPWWATMVSYSMVALSILGIIFLLWYLGIGHLLRKVFYSLGMFIPESKIKQATLARKTLDTADPTTSREMVAALRASDPAFEAAFKKIKEKKNVS